MQAAGKANLDSFVPTCLSNIDETQDMKEQKRTIMETAGAFFVGMSPYLCVMTGQLNRCFILGGADTTIHTIVTFILQMTLNPDIQAKAHAELDRVVGKFTLPTFADEASLPYIGAIAKEVLRCDLQLNRQSGTHENHLHVLRGVIYRRRWRSADGTH